MGTLFSKQATKRNSMLPQTSPDNILQNTTTTDSTLSGLVRLHPKITEITSNVYVSTTIP